MSCPIRLIIAATAELLHAEVPHVDSDYGLIAGVTDQSVRRLSDPAAHNHATAVTGVVMRVVTAMILWVADRLPVRR